MPDTIDSTDGEMVEMEMETESNAAQHAHPQPEQAQDDAVRGMLALARDLISQGKPSQALQAVVMAMKAKGGEQAVFQSLHRARELYRKKLQENAAVDQLASLFAECAIEEAQPIRKEQPPPNIGGPSVASDDQGTSILAETGRMQIVLDASLDGSSFVCLRCGGLVSNHRKDEHYAYWCGGN